METIKIKKSIIEGAINDWPWEESLLQTQEEAV